VIHLGAARLIHLGAATLIQAAGSRGILRPEVPRRPRKDTPDLQELLRLHPLVTPIGDAARALKMSRDTLRLHKERLRGAGLLERTPDGPSSLEQLPEAVPQRGPPQQRSTAADGTARIAELVAAGHEPGAIFQRLQLEEPRSTARSDAMKLHRRGLREQLPPPAEDVDIRVEAPPVEVGQLDVGYVGELVDPATGEARRDRVFVLARRHSRHLLPWVVFDPSARTWFDGQLRAPASFGGAPRAPVPELRSAPGIRPDARLLTPPTSCPPERAPRPPRERSRTGRLRHAPGAPAEHPSFSPFRFLHRARRPHGLDGSARELVAHGADVGGIGRAAPTTACQRPSRGHPGPTSTP
jgi:hypothetical protein